MALYFVQHGIALAKAIEPNRPLSADGRKDIEHISAYLRMLGIKVKKIYHSGKTRAMETALIFSGHIGDGNIYISPGMNPDDDVMDFASGMDEPDTMYVGHLPHMEKLVSYLVTGNEEAGVVKFTNGGVVCIEKDDKGFHILWYLRPSICKG